MIAATLEWGDEDEIAMLNRRKKDCTELAGKSLTAIGFGW
jgi:hypothetical protein